MSFEYAGGGNAERFPGVAPLVLPFTDSLPFPFPEADGSGGNDAAVGSGGVARPSDPWNAGGGSIPCCPGVGAPKLALAYAGGGPCIP